MLEDYLNGNFESILKKDITVEQFRNKYLEAQAKNRLMLSCTFMHPGIKGFSMGDETGELTPSRYFAQYDNKDIEKFVSEQKGYDVGEEAFKKSSKIYNKIKDEEFSKSTTALSKDFIKLISQNPALKYGDYNKIAAEPVGEDSILIHRWDERGKDIFALVNFSDSARTYKDIKNFPKGVWREVLNTDDVKYNGTGVVNNKNKFIDKNNEISLAPYSVAVFKSV